MKLPASAPSSAAAEEAALWAARLDGDPLDGARRAELDAWLARDPRRLPVFLRWNGIDLAAAAVLAFTVWIARPVSEVQNLATAVAQRGDGEAVFTVAKDATRPFIVRTPAGSVRVTGTTFSVRNDPAAAVSLEVLVVEGSVPVRPSDTTATPAGGPFSLQAGDRLAAGSRGVEVRALTNSAIENALAWREGYAVFDDVPLHEATARFAGRRPMRAAPPAR